MNRLPFLVALLLAPVASHASGVSNDSFLNDKGGRVLRERVVVDAPLRAVWDAFTTDAGFESWAAPRVHVVTGNGGTIEFTLSKDGRIGDPGNVRHRIDVFVPEQVLVFHNEFVPAGGPIDPVLFKTVQTILEFEPAGDAKTRVTETVVGFGDGAGYDALYSHLQAGNAEYLELLAKHFSKEGERS